MTEQEMKTELARAIKLRDMSQAALDAHIVRIATLELDLAAAEKPELTHGDYWIKKGCGINIFLKEHIWDRRDFVATKDFVLTNIGSDYNGELILGNIFKEMESLAKPLTYFKADVHEYKIDFTGHAHAPVEVAGNWHTLAEAKQISLKLQRLVRTAAMEEAK